MTEFRNQLSTTLVPLLKRWKLCENVTPVQDGDAVHAIVACTVLKQFTFEIQVEYSHLYCVPQLIFKIWETTDEHGTEVRTLTFPSDLSSLLLIQNFSVGLDYVHKQNKDIWYSVHACDTRDVVGEQTENYLERWASIYLTIFDPDFSKVFSFVVDPK